MSTTCIFCSSAENLPAQYSVLARLVATNVALGGDEMVFGGIRRGLMRVVAEAAQRGGAKVIGVYPESKKALAEEYGCRLNDRNIETAGLAQRKHVMIEMSDNFAVLPGGYGTLDELMSTVTEITFGGLTGKHITIYNLDGLYDPILEQLRLMRERGLLTAPLESLVTVENIDGSALLAAQ